VLSDRAFKGVFYKDRIFGLTLDSG